MRNMTGAIAPGAIGAESLCTWSEIAVRTLRTQEVSPLPETYQSITFEQALVYQMAARPAVGAMPFGRRGQTKHSPVQSAPAALSRTTSMEAV